MGRQRRISGYIHAPLRRTKNLQTRRTRIAEVHRDIYRLASSSKNKRLK